MSFWRTEKKVVEEPKKEEVLRCYYCNTKKDVSENSGYCIRCDELRSIQRWGRYEPQQDIVEEVSALLQLRSELSPREFRCYREKILEKRHARQEEERQKSLTVARKKLSQYKECRYLE